MKPMTANPDTEGREAELQSEAEDPGLNVAPDTLRLVNETAADTVYAFRHLTQVLGVTVVREVKRRFTDALCDPRAVVPFR